MNQNSKNGSGNQNEAPAKAPKRRSWLWPAGRFCLLGLATLATLFVLFHLEENWRGKRAWKNYKAKMEAQGAVFELSKLVPPPVPDDQNFAMTPLLKPLFDMYPPGTTNASRWRDEAGRKRAESIVLEDPEVEAALARSDADSPRRADWRLGERTSLKPWQEYYRQSKVFPSWPEPRTAAEDVLKALSRYDAELAELKGASLRPHARFNLPYEEENPYLMLFPHLNVLKSMARVLQLKALAELEAGNADAAFEDVNLMLTLADSLQDEPVLISHLVRLAILEVTYQTIWEGLNDHRWSQAHLERLQQRLVGMDLVAELRRAMEAERAFGTGILELMIRNPGMASQLLSADSAARPAISILPRGWFCFEAVNYNQVFDDYLLKVIPNQAAGLDVGEAKRAAEEMDRELSEGGGFAALLQHRVFMRMLLPALGNVIIKSSRAEAMKGMAVTAMALERYHLANGAYPASLDSLAPRWIAQLPQDPITHEPFRYERGADGTFRLWSVGWNEKDDGGTVAVTKGKTGRPIDREGDWVWPRPEGVKTMVTED